MNQFGLKFLAPFIVFCLAFKLSGAQDTELWGLTVNGGKFKGGTIFKTNSDGSDYQQAFSFAIETEGTKPGFLPKLCKSSNGKFYGLTEEGGKNNNGVLYEFDPSNNKYTKLIDFEEKTTGKSHGGQLIEASNGKLYGVASSGGEFEFGTLFEFDFKTNKLEVLYNFDRKTNGGSPYPHLLEGKSNKLYGLANSGGSNQYGVLFAYDFINKSFNKILDLDGETTGMYPNSGLVFGPNQNELFCTQYLGSSKYGGIFEYNFISKETKFTDFDDELIGRNPLGDLLLMPNNKMYGLTYSGGEYDNGTLFEFDPEDGSVTKKIDLNEAITGKSPRCGLMKASNGKLYGIARSGGTYGDGVLFEYNPDNNTLMPKLNFESSTTGSSPQGTLIEHVDGNIYGLTTLIGKKFSGAIFKYNYLTDDTETVYDFVGHPNGNFPAGSLLHASNGNLYGTAMNGGKNDYGVFFQFKPKTKAFQTIHHFNKGSMGYFPNGSFLEINDELILGITRQGGKYNKGAIYQFNPKSGSIKSMFELGDTINSHRIDGVNSSLILTSNNRVFGICQKGGVSKLGILFEIDLEKKEIIKKFDFKDDHQGYEPIALAEGANGKLYGLTSEGSPTGKGVIFEYDYDNDKYSFKKDLESDPTRSLLKHSNSNFYGYFVDDWLNGDFGSIFEYNPVNNSFKTIYNLKDADGVILDYPLLESSNGLIYGLSSVRNKISQGVLFEFNISKGTFTKMQDFNLKMGVPAYGCKLTEIESCLSSSEIDLSVLQKDGTLRSNDDEGSYQWIDCNNDLLPIEGKTEKTFTPDKNGSYAVKITKNNCSEISSCYDVVLGISKTQIGHDFLVSPNPTYGKINIALHKTFDKIQLSITNLIGKEIYAKTYTNCNEINTEIKAPKGVYLVTVKTKDGKQSTFKVVKN